MSMSYLSSRAEILRSMYIDTGIRIAMIGSPHDFNQWIDTGVPENTDYLMDPGGIGEGVFYDRILVWDESDMDIDPVSLIAHINTGGEIWVVLPTMGDLRDPILAKYHPLKEMGHDPIPLSMSLEIYPVHISSRRA